MHTEHELTQHWTETLKRQGIHSHLLVKEKVAAHLESQQKAIELRAAAHEAPKEVIQHLTQSFETKPITDRLDKALRALWAIVALLFLLCLLSIRGHAQFSHINTIGIQQSGTQIGFQASPFNLNFTGCTVTLAGNTYSISCSGGTNNPGGNSNDVQTNSGGTAFGAIASSVADGATAGQVLIVQPSGAPAFADPLVQGTQAAASVTEPNPVMGGVWDGTNLRAILGDSSGRQVVNVNGSVAVTGTFFQATQPVSGTFFQATQPVSAASLPLPAGAATAAKQPALGTAGSASTDVISVQGIGGGTALPVSGTFWQTTQPVSGTFWQTTQPVSNTGLTDLDSSIGTPASGVPAKAVQMSGTDGTNVIVPFIDPCQRGAKTYTPINVASTTSTKLVALTSGKIIYVCSVNLISGGANNVALLTGTKVSTECDTGTAGLNGGTTAATGWNFAANGGIADGNGSSAVLAGGTSKDICLLASGSSQLSGTIVTATF